jgi:hypothetical protein
MTKYRLKPVSENLWIVQERWYFLWCDCTKSRRIGNDFFGPMIASDPHYVHSVADGKAVIAEKRKFNMESAARAKRDAEFRRSNKPINY